MFQNGTQKELQWLENGRVLGIVHLNTEMVFQNFIRPFIHNGRREVLSIGRVNYALLDAFIMNSMNDFYAHINEEKNATLRNQKVNEYNTLYQLWYQVNAAKQSHNPYLNSYYDDIVYRLYLLGYHK